VKFVYCAGEMASIAINFSPEGLKAHTFFRSLVRFRRPSLASGENSLREIRCIRIDLRRIPEAVAVSNLCSSKKGKKN
jgi:hypothetical protein